ncbi:uncharacterized protein RHOBADRAFT_54696 [Rhodotorula graminis WP1]|uniref:ER membrane protein complex subunit 2 n=1 Tax=Rhodotorula graminis (strain WP1) TaxID=578459 RepID=A0A0P9GJZ8_RHOGW|nr:uncharacterized protein RHOBADRAFT_54696 [Rhodotorula graminis WP1]KPV73476.1 hypothetical protein RHOBADRAFT_54696 [Rhodotorula graminis WP1]
MSAQTIRSSSTATLLADLRKRRLEQRRDFHLVLLTGLELEQRGQLNGGSDDQWEAAEQVAVAAVEGGNVDLVQTLVLRLDKHYRDSQPHRANYLHGLVLEVRGDLDGARNCYERNVQDDETDVPSRKRLIALHLSSPLVTLPDPPTKGSPSASVPASAQPYLAASLHQQKGISVLVHYLDIYYTDLAGWLSLATAYAQLALYAQALAALAHAVVLAPSDPWVKLKFAETAYTQGDVALAWKEFLRVVEMSTEAGDKELKGAARRAAMGAKLCLPRLRTPEKSKKASKDADALLAPAKLDEMDLLLSKLLLDAYHKTDGAVGAGVVERWIGGGAEAGPR